MLQLPLPLGIQSPLREIRALLLSVLGPQRDAQRHDPISQLVKGIVSSCTKDRVSNPAFLKLQDALAWYDLPDIAPKTIEDIISDVTRPDVKSVQLVGATRMIRAQRGDLDLNFLTDWPLGSGLAWLDRLPGVGAKTAAVVLNFSTLRKPVLVVDRHVLRVCKRLGLLPEKSDYERGFRLLSRLVPPDWSGDDLYELHWLVKMLGQAVCTHNRPACAICPLATICETSRKQWRDR